MSPVAERFYNAQFFDLLNYTCEEFPILDSNAALTRLLVALRHCAATTETGFKKWSRAFIRQMADEIAEEQVSSFEQVIEIAQRRDTEPKPPFITEQHHTRPEVTFVKIERGHGHFSVWVVSTDRLPLVQILHPTVAVRFTRIANRRYAYLVKKCQRQNYNGSWSTVERDLSAIWLGVDEHHQAIEAIDGNYLNFLPGNLRVYALPKLDALNFAPHPLRDEKDTLDWKPTAPTAVPFNEDDRELSYDSPTERPLSKHDIDVLKLLHGDAWEIEVPDEAPKSVDAEIIRLRQRWGVQ